MIDFQFHTSIDLIIGLLGKEDIMLCKQYARLN
jgi:hypothetical protein